MLTDSSQEMFWFASLQPYITTLQLSDELVNLSGVVVKVRNRYAVTFADSRGGASSVIPFFVCVATLLKSFVFLVACDHAQREPARPED